MTLLIVTTNQQSHVISAKLLTFLYFLMPGNKTVPMIVMYKSCDCITKNGYGVKWLHERHKMVPEHLMQFSLIFMKFIP
jgi:hypothetical protein